MHLAPVSAACPPDRFTLPKHSLVMAGLLLRSLHTVVRGHVNAQGLKECNSRPSVPTPHHHLTMIGVLIGV